MYQNSNLYESWINTYSGNQLTGSTSKAYVNGYELHYKTTIDYNNNRVSAITSYDSTASAWIKEYDAVVTSWSAEGFPSEIINTFYDASGFVRQQNINQFTYSSGQLKEKKQLYYYMGTLTQYQRTEYNYDQNARLVKEVTFNQDSSQYGTVDITWQNNLVVQANHFVTICSRGERKKFWFVGWQIGGNKDNFIERELNPGISSKFQMPTVDRIKGPSQNTDLHAERPLLRTYMAIPFHDIFIRREPFQPHRAARMDLVG